MSLDNGIYILKHKNEKKNLVYRVNMIFAVENIFKSFAALVGAFENSPVYENLKQVEQATIELEKESLTEHDILFISHYAEYTWPQLQALANEPQVTGVAA